MVKKLKNHNLMYKNSLEYGDFISSKIEIIPIDNKSVMNEKCNNMYAYGEFVTPEHIINILNTITK